MSSVLFFIAATGVISGAVGVVVLRNPFYSVLALVGHLISLAVLFLLLRAEFVAAVQVVVYAGAVMVLYVFVVAYVGGESETIGERLRPPPGGPAAAGLRLGGAVLAGALLVELLIALLGTGLKAVDGNGAGYNPGHAPMGLPLHRPAAADPIPAGVRDRLLPTADRRCRRGGRSGTTARAAWASAGRPRRWTCCGRRARDDGRGSREAPAMTIGWYLAVSAIVFTLGAVGVMTRRNPLVVLLCLELMLNAANLALVAFSRMWGNGDGQILALIVMTVAACEVTIGLGMIVAIYRRRLPIDVDELRELQG